MRRRLGWARATEPTPRGSLTVPAGEVPARALAALRASADRASLLACAVVATVIATSAIRIAVGADEQLWLDETWTGLHASRPTFAAFLREVVVDINAPLYYLLAWLWASVSGLSNAALRFPSLVFGLVLPLLALIPTREIDRTTRLIWCALLATWVPGLFQSQEARCYTMLLVLATAGTILHARLLARPTLRRACAWAAVGALAILTHYYAAILFGCQGLAYLALHRGRALRTWPAALAYGPAFGWMAWQLPQLAGFAETNWYAPLPLLGILPVFGYAVGWTKLVLPLTAIGLPRTRPGFGRRPDGAPSVLPWVVGAGLLAAAILVAAGMLRPLFTLRYMTIFAPTLLLGVALWARTVGERRSFAPPLLILACAVAAIDWSLSSYGAKERITGWERASDALMAAGAREIAFTWDNRSTAGLMPAQMADLGAFFVRRARYDAEIRGVVLRPGDDPNLRLTAAVSGPQAAILWIYDLDIAGTAAAMHPPAIDRTGPGWTCRDHGRGRVGVVACHRSGAP